MTVLRRRSGRCNLRRCAGESLRLSPGARVLPRSAIPHAARIPCGDQTVIRYGVDRCRPHSKRYDRPKVRADARQNIGDGARFGARRRQAAMVGVIERVPRGNSRRLRCNVDDRCTRLRRCRIERFDDVGQHIEPDALDIAPRSLAFLRNEAGRRGAAAPKAADDKSAANVSGASDDSVSAAASWNIRPHADRS